MLGWWYHFGWCLAGVVVSLWLVLSWGGGITLARHAFRRPGRSAAAFPGGRRSLQSDTTTPPEVLCQSKDKLRVRCIDRSIRLGICQYGKDASPILLAN
ncbi:hypothetical protein [Nitrincola sp.]|uniref:hypothetical protein n=1 Tax=Nitrincola sp. TaxID=1926584 RepID=UPI003A8DC21A